MGGTLTSCLLVLVTAAVFTTSLGLPLLTATGKASEALQDKRDNTRQFLNETTVLTENDTQQSAQDTAVLVGGNTHQSQNDTAVLARDNPRHTLHYAAVLVGGNILQSMNNTEVLGGDNSRQSLNDTTVVVGGNTRQSVHDRAVVVGDKTGQSLHNKSVFAGDNTRQSLNDTAVLLWDNTRQFQNTTAVVVGGNTHQSLRGHADTVGDKSHQSVQDQVRRYGIQYTSNAPVKQGRTEPSASDFCFQDKHSRSGNVASCSHNHATLTYIPRLPSSVKFLWLAFNNLTVIPTDDFFQNVTRIQRLDLSNNGLQFISPGAFGRLRFLRRLYLDHNNLSPGQLQRVFSAKGMSSLFLRYMKLAVFSDEVFGGRTMFHLQWLDLSHNFLEYLNLTVFKHTPHLEHLNVIDNHLVRVTSDFMPYLRVMLLNSNALFHLPQSCSDNGTSFFPRLTGVSFKYNKFSAFPEDEPMCFTSLVRLGMDGNPIRVLVKDMFGEKRFPWLRGLSLEKIQHISFMERFALRSPTLESLSLMYNNIGFGVDGVQSDSFAEIPRLVFLQLSHNFFLYATDLYMRQLFEPLGNLRKLYMGGCYITGITENTFSALKNLTLLSVYKNTIRELPDHAFDSLANLESLTVSSNELKTIRESVFSPETRHRLKKVDFSGNPFTCDCDLLWFQNWLASPSSVFSRSYGPYKCGNVANTSVQNFSLSQQQCMWSHETYGAIIACVVIFIFAVIVVSAVYHHRWRIRLMLAFRGRGEALRRRLETEHFDYDVFVSFAGEDLDWVLQHLVPKLEEERGLRLCIHERDFRPGKNILNNIVDSINASKKYLLVFSRHFTHSPWCQFELDLCLGHTLDYDDLLIVACLGDVASRDLTSTMAAVLETTTYIQWRPNRDAATLFWDRVELVLKDIMQNHEDSHL